MISIGGRTRTCGLVGYPVAHTLSPLIHNSLAEATGQDMVYVPFPVEPERVGDAVEGAYALNITGLNVTVPHKSAVIAHLREMDALAEKIGAVNTLVRCEGGYKGYNTDMTGLQRAMASDGVCLEGERVILLGAGGAARAVAFLCASAGVEAVYLLNRTPARAQEVAAEVNRVCGRDCIRPLAGYGELPEGRFLAIQGTSAGLYPHVEDTPIADAAFFEKVHTGYDLIYRPGDTRFMQLVRSHGGRAFNGLKMLAYQGIHAFELWNGVHVDEALAETVIQKLRKETEIHG